LGVGAITEGTSRLHSEVIEEIGDAMRQESVKKARDPDRCRKIAEARRGKPRPQHILDAMHEARRGSHHTEGARRKMSEAQRRRVALVPGTVPWTAEEDELVRTLPAEEVVRRTGRSLSGVYAAKSAKGAGRKTDRVIPLCANRMSENFLQFSFFGSFGGSIKRAGWR
jgi:hypothetical protein